MTTKNKTIIVGAISASQIARRKKKQQQINPAIAAVLKSVTFVTVERKPDATFYHALIQDTPLQPIAIRRCLLASTCNPSERADVERLDIAPGLTNFRMTIGGGKTELQARTHKAMMMRKPGIATWCTWNAMTPEKDSTPVQFWTTHIDVDISDFVHEILPMVTATTVHYEASVVQTEQESSWTKGIIEYGGQKMGFYRILQ